MDRGITFSRTDHKNNDFKRLVAYLDEELGQRDGKEHAFYHQFNSISGINYALVAYSQGVPIGCGAIKPFDADTMEVKRMFVVPENRGEGIATLILKELETWATQLKYTNCVLETGKRQPEAIALYKKNGYQITSNYGQYIGVENSVCFRKKL